MSKSDIFACNTGASIQLHDINFIYSNYINLINFKNFIALIA